MITITIDNSFSKITGLTTSQFSALRNLLSYETDPQAAYFSGGFRRKKYLIDKAGRFPTGLLARTAIFCTNEHLEITYVDARKNPYEKPTCRLNAKLDKTPYEDQIKAAQGAVRSERGGIIQPTGTGKSLTIALIINELKVRTLVIVPNLEIKKQLSESLTQLFGPTPCITVENIDSPALKTATNYDCLIIDECHHAAAKTYQVLNKTAWAGIYYRFFLTATFFRNNENEHLLFEGICGQVIYRLEYKDAVKKGYIVPVESYYLDVTGSSKDTDGSTWRQVYHSMVVKNYWRNQMIGGLLSRLEDKYALCLVKEIEHGNELRDLTGVPFANGQDESSRSLIEDFKQGKIKTLIATTGLVGEGVDTVPCEFVIIAGLGKAKSSFQQMVGRAVRRYAEKKSAKVIIFRDKDHKWTKAHYKAQCKILLEEYGVKPVELEL